MKKFKTDGCSVISFIWKLLFKLKIVKNELLPFHFHCVEHDKFYYEGGTKKERYFADCLLMAKIAKQGYPICSFIVFLAVRFGGMPYLPFPWRWGFGHKYFKNYTKD